MTPDQIKKMIEIIGEAELIIWVTVNATSPDDYFQKMNTLRECGIQI